MQLTVSLTENHWYPRQLDIDWWAIQRGITPVNLSVLKNNRAKAVRFSTLAALCAALDCQPGDIFGVE